MEICFFHKNCIDGTVSASLLLEKNKDIILIPLNHGSSSKDILKNYDVRSIKKVWYVDIAPKEEDIDFLQKEGIETTVIDHHKTIIKTFSKYFKDIENKETDILNLKSLSINLIYNPYESGASLTFKFLNNALEKDSIPKLIDIVKDKDLWLWRYEETDKITSYLSLFVDSPEKMLEALKEDEKTLKEKGEVLALYKETNIKKLYESWKSNKLFLNIENIKIPAINITMYQSEVCNILANEPIDETKPNEKYGIACAFHITGSFVKLSFRSLRGEARKIAEKLGGGGHDNASGAIIDTDTFFKEFLILE